MAKRLLCVVLSLLMIIAVLPTGVVAATTNWTDADSLPSSAGTYKLMTDVNVTEATTITGTVVLDLNGYTITSSCSGSYMYIVSGGTLTIQDSSTDESGEINFVSGYGIKVTSSGTLNITGGTLERTSPNTTSGYGTAFIYISTGTVNVSGGCIIENATVVSGKDYSTYVFYVSSGSKLYVTGGTIITKHTSGYFVYKSGTVSISGGSFSGFTTSSSSSGFTSYLKSGSYLLSYDDKVDSEEITVPYYQVGSTLTISTDIPVRDGYTFTGWNTASDGTGTTYAAGDSITISAATTLYAQWEEEVTTVAPTLYGRSLSLGTQIGVNYYFNFDESSYDADECTVKYVVGSGSETAVESWTSDGTTYYIATCRVYFYQMAQDITINIYDSEDSLVASYSGGSVLSYYNNIKDVSGYESLASLMVAMLNYGGYGQTYVENVYSLSTGTLANSGIEDAYDSSSDSIPATYKASLGDDNVAGYTLGGQLVISESDSCKIKFTISSLPEGVSASDLTVTIDGVAADPTDAMYTDYILVQDWDEAVKVVITYNETVYTLEYSVLSYAYSVLADDEQDDYVKNLAWAIYNYNQAVEAYK
ncbi:MAG: InlB B-repeat-containing protein [Oscillospiraceae bacterium]|nr:InlB B-repeat-containing protein [Oscillospiraceae bacterium]